MTFSVIVPFYNVEKYARKCIESILNQTYKDFELILVDDGSPDKCPQILDEYEEKDKRIVVIHKKNGGLVSARKAGAKIARGEYVVIVDGDDWIDEEYLAVFKKAIDENEADIYCCKYRKVDDNGSLFNDKKRQDKYVGQFSKEEIEEIILPNLFSLRPHVWSKAFRRSIYQKFQMNVDDRITIGEDGVVTYPLMCYSDQIVFLDRSLYYYRYNPESMTNRKRKYIEWENSLLKVRYYEEILPPLVAAKRELLASYAIHSYFNVVLSHFQNGTYWSVCKEIDKRLDDKEIQKYLSVKPIHNSFKVQCAQLALKYRMYLIIKLYSIL